jgi:pilus assembly protein Flp/PilA
VRYALCLLLKNLGCWVRYVGHQDFIFLMNRCQPSLWGNIKMSNFIKWFVRDERGVSAMEYAVLAGIVAVALGGVAATFGTSVGTMFSTMFSAISTQQAK